MIPHLLSKQKETSRSSQMAPGWRPSPLTPRYDGQTLLLAPYKSQEKKGRVGCPEAALDIWMSPQDNA